MTPDVKALSDLVKMIDAAKNSADYAALQESQAMRNARSFLAKVSPSFDMEKVKRQCEINFQNGGPRQFIIKPDGSIRQGGYGCSARELIEFWAQDGDIVLARRKHWKGLAIPEYRWTRVKA